MENKPSLFDKGSAPQFTNGLIKSFARIGLALENILKPGSPSLLPLKLTSEDTQHRLKQHFESCEKKLEDSMHDDICKVPAPIGVPILDELVLLDQSALSEAFVNLLSKAATYSTLGEVHPGFIATLKSMSSDEATILMHFKDANRIPLIDFQYRKYQELIPRPTSMDIQGAKTGEQLKQEIAYTFQDTKEVFLDILLNGTAMEDYIPLIFKNNIHLYLYNMNKLGLIDFVRSKYSPDDEPAYNRLLNTDYKEYIDILKNQAKDYNEDGYKVEVIINRGYITFSDYGKAFMKACIMPIEKSKDE